MPTSVFAFINVQTLDDTKDPDFRRKVSRHVGRYHRNRSKPSQKALPKRWPSQIPTPERLSSKSGRGARRLLPTKALTSDVTEFAGGGRCSNNLNSLHVANPRNVAHIDSQKGSVDDATEEKPCLHISNTNSHTLIPQKPFPPYPSQFDNAASSSALDHSPLNILSQSRSDPFATYPVNDSHDHTSLLVDHAVHYFWSCLSPNQQSGHKNPVNALYLSHMKSSPIAYYTYALVISTNLDFLSRSSPLQLGFSVMRAKYIHAATALVLQAIKEMPPHPNARDIGDELIGSVLGLSSTNVIKAVHRKDGPRSRFCSPLTTAQCIDMWSAIPFIESHRLAVIQLVRLKGGLKGLDSKYLAAVVELNDLIDASRKTRKPTWLWEDTTVDLAPIVWPFVPPQILSSRRILTSSFVELTVLLPCRSEIETAISAVAEVTVELEMTQKKATNLSADLIEIRNRAQHMVLSIRHVTSLEVLDYDSQQYEHEFSGDYRLDKADTMIILHELIRLSLLIYTNLVIYPMSVNTGVETRLAKSLKKLLQYCFPHPELEGGAHESLLIWSVMLGGISTESSEDRGWYQDYYRKLTRHRDSLKRWRWVEDLLSSFIWLDFVLNAEAIKFWVACMDS